MSYSNSFPSVRPTTFDFANSGKLDSRISFSRADTPPTYAAPSAVHYWSNEKHLSSENLVRYSNDLSNGDWTKARLTVASTNNSAPDGTTTASSLLEETDNSTHTFYEDYTSVVGVSYTHVWYAKANGRTKFVAYAQGSSCVYDLTAATATNSGMDAVSITALGSSWFKCVATKTATTTSGRLQFEFNNGSSQSYAGDVTKGLLFWGFNISSTGQTVTNSVAGSIHREFASTLKSVANAGDPRFEYDPITGNSEGLLIEQQSTNLTVSSQQVENWTPQEATVQANVAIAPDGTLGADKLTESTTAASIHWIYKSSALGVSVGSTVYTVSFYAKAAGRTKFQSYDNNQTAGGNIYVDLTDGSITGGAGKVESVGSGWYRISYQAVADNSTTSTVRILMLDAGGSGTYDGDGFSGILLWGMQVEIGSAPTSYIKTTTSATATRSADSCSVADFGYTGGPVSVIAEANMTSPTTETSQKSVFELGDGTSDNRIWVYNNFGKADSLYVRADGVTGMFEAGTVTTDDDFTVAVRVDTNNSGRSTNGGSVTSDTSVVMPSGLDTLYIGRSKSTSVNALNGHIKRLSLYSVALSDVELQSLTSS